MGPWGAIAGAFAGATGSLLGSLGKNDSVSKEQKGVDAMRKSNENWYNRRYNEDPTQRLSAQRMITKLEDIVRRRNKAAEGRRAMVGGTEESVAAEKERNNQMMADAVSQIAAYGDAQKDRIEQQYLNRKNRLDEQYLGLEGEKQGTYDILGGMIGGSVKGMSAGMSLGG